MKLELICFESLETRSLLSASISGTVFYDSDVSQTADAREPGLAGWTVYLDKNADGVFDAGDAAATTDRLGRYNFKRVGAGDYLVGVVDHAGYAQTSPGPTGSVRGRFHIALNLAAGMSAIERSAFAAAARRWESIITSEPDTTDSHAANNLLTIDASIKPIDGVDGTLAESEPTEFRSDDDLPTAGSMTFDRDDMQSLEDSGMLKDTILHEMAHVLGFGTIWEDDNLITGESAHHPRFTGAMAVQQFDRVFGSSLTYVPVEAGGGDGTANSHWDQDTFSEELMTGYAADPGVTVPLSAVTVGQFSDLGYNVNITAADAWNPRKHTTVKTMPLMLGAKAGESRVTVVDGDAATDLTFGYRADTAPTLRMAVASTTGNAGDAVTLSVARVADAEGDAIAGVSFFRESNGVAGLQTGVGGDTFIVTRTAAKRGIYQTTAPSSATPGSQYYYASAADSLGFSRRRSVAITLTAPAPPARPRAVIASRKSSNSLLVQWNSSPHAAAYRVELATAASFDSTSIVRAFNIAAPATTAVIGNLTAGAAYYTRVRGYNASGASGYTTAAALVLT